MHPILVYLPTPWGELPIYSYGVMLGLSLIVAWYMIMFLGARKEKLDRELMANAFIVTAVAAILGARLLYILTNLDDFEDINKWFQFRSGGLVAYGGFIGGFIGSWAYMKMKKVPLMAWADVVAPTLGTGTALTRIGCYLYGCDFGARLADDAPGWLKSIGTFPHWHDEQPANLVCSQEVQGSPAWSHHVREYDLPFSADASFPVHPTQIYEALAGVALFLITVWVWRNRKFRGQVTMVIVMGYSVWRFFIEMVRDDPERGAALGFSTSQIISLALLPLAGFAYVYMHKRAREQGETPIPASALIKTEAAAEDGAGPGDKGKRSSSRKVKRRKR